jgi:hypothetical protein
MLFTLSTAICWLLLLSMADKRRYTVSLPDHVTDAVEKHAKPLGATPTEYAADIIKWWFGQGCPAVTPDEAQLRKTATLDAMMSRVLPLPADLNVWKLNPKVDYNLVDAPVEKAMVDLGIPNLFAHGQEHDAVRITAAFDNHPTHWLVFNFFKGSGKPGGDGVSMYAYSKSSVTRSEMVKKLQAIAKEMEAERPIPFSQIPVKAPAALSSVQT